MHIKKYIQIIFLLFFILHKASASEDINIYAYSQADMLSLSVKKALFRVYVPNTKDGTVSVIDPSTYKVIDTFHTGKNPQHVVPSYDLQTLWVLNNNSNTLTPIDPTTSKPGKSVAVDDPYNLYFTPDGKYAIVVCEGRMQLQFRDPKSIKLQSTLATQCKGANHMEFSVDGKFAIITCENSSQLMKVDLEKQQVVKYLSLNEPNKKSKPQDIRSSADGKIFFVADMMKDGVDLIDPINFTQIGFIPTGIGTHGVYPSRDGKLFYVSNRGCHQISCGSHGPGNVSVIDPNQQKVIATWNIPQGGSPDMGNVTANGKELWLSGRYDNEVYVFDTATGQLTHRIPVGAGPHGLTVWPQPGRYSLGHTGNMR